MSRLVAMGMEHERAAIRCHQAPKNLPSNATVSHSSGSAAMKRN